MTLLITGVSGLLGRSIAELCKNKNIKYLGTYNSRKVKNAIKVNFNDENDIKQHLIQNNISVCINCIVERQVDICENNWEDIKKINIDITNNLAKVCNSLNIYLIHISTDYVFDGRKSPYYPDHETNPLQNYGISKLISEKRVIANTKKYTIIRVPVLYSNIIENLSENAITLIGKKVLNPLEDTTEDNYSIRRPVFIPDLSEFIISFIKRPLYGIYHYYNVSDKCTKYEIAKMIGTFLNKSTEHIKPVTQFNILNRPYDTELKDDKYDITQYGQTHLERGIEMCFKKWKHPSITHSTNKSVFIMMDLDGTILDTDKIHYQSYKKAFDMYNINLTRDTFDNIINISTIDNFILENNLDKIELKRHKTKFMLENTKIEFMAGADTFLEKIILNEINFVIITNTSKDIVEYYKRNVPLLNKVNNWICREDYVNPKPDSECYKLAIHKYYKGEEYKIGFENTIVGYNAIKNDVDCVYFITNNGSVNYNKIKKEDVYLFSDFINVL